jgi:hypothetical protein
MDILLYQVFRQFFCGRQFENNELAMLHEGISNTEQGMSNDEVFASAL